MLIHRFAGDDTNRLLDYQQLAREAHASLDQVASLIRQLGELGLVKYEEGAYAENTGDVRLTVTGVDRARHLSVPAWRRPFQDRAFRYGILGGILVLFTSELVKRLLALL